MSALITASAAALAASLQLNPVTADGAKANGTDDDLAAVQATMNRRGTVVVNDGTLKLSATPTMPSPPVNFKASSGVQVTGAVQSGNWGSIPTFGHSITNEYNLIDYSYSYAAPNIARPDPGNMSAYPFGSFTSIYEMEPGTAFKGNADAAFFGTVGDSGVYAALGGINAMSSMKAGFLGNANAAEFDIDNDAGDMKGLGLVIQGLGTYRLDSAIKIGRVAIGSQSPTGAGGNWIPPYEYGIQINNVNQGLVIDQSEVQSPQHAILVKPGPQRAADQPAIALQTPDGNVPFYVRADGLIAPRESAVITNFASVVVSSGITGETATEYLRADGFVQLAGWAAPSPVTSGGVVAANTVLFTLDPHYRPNRTVILPAMLSNGTQTWVQIGSDGTVKIGAQMQSSAVLDLDAVSFRLLN